MEASQDTNAQMCGYFSITQTRDFDESASALRYFKSSKTPVDLNEGLQNILEKPDSYFDEKMDHLLKYIVNNKSDLLKKNVPGNGTALIPSTKYITFRGALRKIMCSPYEDRKGWTMFASKYKGNIYMGELNSNNFDISPDWLKRFELYGPKFEQCCLSDHPSKEPDTTTQIDDCTQFFCVYKRKLIGRDFLFAAEMDGVASKEPVKLDNPDTFKDLRFIELKVCADPHRSARAEGNFRRFKCSSVWAQSFLVGLQDVYFGFRNESGMVFNIGHYDIDELPEKCKHHWNPSTFFKFLSKFLQLVEDKLKDVDCPHTVHEFNYDERTGAISHHLHEGETEMSFLPDWYLDAMNSGT